MNLTRNLALPVLAAAALFVAVPPTRAQPPPSLRSPDEIDQIVGPIALYPDPLVSVVLPAATWPDEIQQAATTVASGNTLALDRAPWDDSVRAIAHYPDLVFWLSDNIDWTAQLGDTFAAQPADVMNSIQRLRARARAAGTLVDTPEQRVVIEGDLIAIVPAEPTRIYVPRYDPAVVYVAHPYRRGADFLSFGAGFATGAWLTYDFDWGRRRVVVADRAWAERRDWSRPSFSIGVGFTENRHEWHAPANRARANVTFSRTVVTPHEFSERSVRPGERPSEPNRRPEGMSRNQPAAPNYNPPPAAPRSQPQPPQPPPPNGAVSSTEPPRRDQDRDRRREEPVRRPEPRGSVTAQSTGEYPPPPAPPGERREAAPNSPPRNDRRPNVNEHAPTATPPRVPERRLPPAANPSTVPPPAPPPNVNSPASTNNAPPNVQHRPESDEEKARRQREEEEQKKKKKPGDGTDGT